MDAELERDPAGVADTLLHALRELQVVPIAWHEIAAGLSDTDELPIALELGSGQAEVEVPRQGQLCHLRVVGIVEPRAATQAFLVRRLLHEHPPCSRRLRCTTRSAASVGILLPACAPAQVGRPEHA